MPARLAVYLTLFWLDLRDRATRRPRDRGVISTEWAIATAAAAAIVLAVVAVIAYKARTAVNSTKTK